MTMNSMMQLIEDLALLRRIMCSKGYDFTAGYLRWEQSASSLCSEG